MDEEGLLRSPAGASSLATGFGVYSTEQRRSVPFWRQHLSRAAQLFRTKLNGKEFGVPGQIDMLLVKLEPTHHRQELRFLADQLLQTTPYSRLHAGLAFLGEAACCQVDPVAVEDRVAVDETDVFKCGYRIHLLWEGRVQLGEVLDQLRLLGHFLLLGLERGIASNPGNQYHRSDTQIEITRVAPLLRRQLHQHTNDSS